MGDFLGNIAARSLDSAPAVQPRPVSLFEPVHREGMLGAGVGNPGGGMEGIAEPDQGEFAAEQVRRDPVPVRRSRIEFSETVLNAESVRMSLHATRPQREYEQENRSAEMPLEDGEQDRPRIQPFIERMTPHPPGVPVSWQGAPPSSRTTEAIHTQPSPGPTVRVTIGRIEVRAAPRAASPQRRRPAPKTMSLDEYLGKRNEGER